MLPKLYQAVYHCIGRLPRQEGQRAKVMGHQKTSSHLIPKSCSFSIRGEFKSGRPLPPLWPLALKNLGFWSSRFKIRFLSPRQGMALSLNLCRAIESPNLKGEQHRRKQREVCGKAPQKRQNDRILIRARSSLCIRCTSAWAVGRGKSVRTAAGWHTGVPEVKASIGPRLLWWQSR